MFLCPIPTTTGRCRTSRRSCDTLPCKYHSWYQVLRYWYVGHLESIVKQAGRGPMSSCRAGSVPGGAGSWKVPFQNMLQVGGEASNTTEERNSSQTDYREYLQPTDFWTSSDHAGFQSEFGAKLDLRHNNGEIISLG